MVISNNWIFDYVCWILDDEARTEPFIALSAMVDTRGSAEQNVILHPEALYSRRVSNDVFRS